MNNSFIFSAVFIKKSHFRGSKIVYKAKDNSEYSSLDFNQPLGLHMNPNNRWIKLADLIPWDEYEERYASRFTSTLGNAAKPCRMALEALIIQKKLGFSCVLSIRNPSSKKVVDIHSLMA